MFSKGFMLDRTCYSGNVLQIFVTSDFDKNHTSDFCLTLFREYAVIAAPKELVALTIPYYKLCSFVGANFTHQCLSLSVSGSILFKVTDRTVFPGLSIMPVLLLLQEHYKN